MKGGTLYRHILRDAWKLTWKHKALWILGFLAVFWGDLGAYQSFNRTFESLSPTFQNRFPAIDAFRASLFVFEDGRFVFNLFLVLLVLMVLAAFFVVVTAGRGGLILSIMHKKEKEKITLRQALTSGATHFWPLLAIFVLTRIDIPIYLLLLGPIVSAPASVSNLLIYMLAFTGVTLISLTLSFLGIFASAFIVLEKMPLFEAIKASLRLFKKHWLISLEFALILYFVSLAVGMAVLLCLFIIAVPFLLLGVIVGLLQLQWATWLLLISAVVVYLAFLLVAGSVFVTFQYAAWVLLYLRLHESNAVAKIMRLTSRFSHVFHRRLI